jgi:hypothetical protein
MAIWKRYCHLAKCNQFGNNDGPNNYYRVMRITFDGKTLSTFRNLYVVNMKHSFAHYFPSSINFFNDQLPTTAYFDLEPILDKYDFLNKTKSGKVLKEWKAALEAVQKELRGMEATMMTDARLNKKFEKLFLKKGNITNPSLNPVKRESTGGVETEDDIYKYHFTQNYSSNFYSDPLLSKTVCSTVEFKSLYDFRFTFNLKVETSAFLEDAKSLGKVLLANYEQV